MEKQQIVNRMLVSAYSAKKSLDRGNPTLAAYYYGQYIADNAYITPDDPWEVADDPTVPHITRDDVTAMFETIHDVFKRLIAPAYNN